MTMTDEEYEAELQARTPEQWAAMKEKASADVDDIIALQHLMWRRDVEDFEDLQKLVEEPDKGLEDDDYILRQFGEIADTLRAARDNPEQRERDRWQNKLLFAAACIGSSEEKDIKWWLEYARDCFPPTRGSQPGDDAPPLDHATYAVECLLDALLLTPECRAELKEKMHAKVMEMFGGVRTVRVFDTPYGEALWKQKQSRRKRDGAKVNGGGQFEMFGAEIVPFKMESLSCVRRPPVEPEPV